MICAPLEGWRHVDVTDRHTAIECQDPQGSFRYVIREGKEDHAYAGQSQHSQTSVTLRSISCRQGTLVGGTVRIASYAKTRQLAGHGEAELSVLSGQSLDRRIPDKLTLQEKVAAGRQAATKNKSKSDWQFTNANARVELKRLSFVV